MQNKGRKPGINNMERYTFRIKTELLQKLKEYAESNNKTVSDIIRRCLEELLKDM